VSPISLDELHFGPATHVSNNNDFPADTQFNGIIFNADAATYTLSGNRLKLVGPLVNNSSATQTIALNLVMQSGGGTIDTASGDIVLSGTVGGSINLVKRGSATLTLANTVSPPITVEQGQVVAAPGSLINGNLTVAVAARFENAGGTVSLRNLTNGGTLVGNARVGGTFINQPSGDVRVGAGQSLYIQNGSPQSNSGLIELIGTANGQAQFESVGPFTNTSGGGKGMIAVQNATLHFDGGLNNQAAIAFSYGVNNVFGKVTNVPGGKISVAGGAGVTFYDDVVQNGILEVSAVGSTHSSVVFYGAYSGGGCIGSGDVFLMGDLRPGNSPVEVTFGGNVLLASSTNTVMELAGLTPGTQYDRLNVIGQLILAGELDLVLLDGFEPKAGESFDLFNATMSGEFSRVTLPLLKNGLSWNTSNLYSTGEISVVPEPSTLGLLGVGCLGLLGYRWRRRRQKRSLSLAGETALSGQAGTDLQENGPAILSMPT